MVLKECPLYFCLILQCQQFASCWVCFALLSFTSSKICMRVCRLTICIFLNSQSLGFYKIIDVEQEHNASVTKNRILAGGKICRKHCYRTDSWTGKMVGGCLCFQEDKQQVFSKDWQIEKCWRRDVAEVGEDGRWLHVEDSSRWCCCKAAEMKITARLQVWNDWGWKVSTQRACFGHGGR